MFNECQLDILNSGFSMWKSIMFKSSSRKNNWKHKIEMQRPLVNNNANTLYTVCNSVTSTILISKLFWTCPCQLILLNISMIHVWTNEYAHNSHAVNKHIINILIFCQLLCNKGNAETEGSY